MRCQGRLASRGLNAGQTSTVTGQLPGLAAAVLPSSRSVTVLSPATAFATIINAGPTRAIVCEMSPATNVPVSFSFQTTESSTNDLIGRLRTPAEIPPGTPQSFV